jgi:hypothetical protein
VNHTIAQNPAWDPNVDFPALDPQKGGFQLRSPPPSKPLENPIENDFSFPIGLLHIKINAFSATISIRLVPPGALKPQREKQS